MKERYTDLGLGAKNIFSWDSIMKNTFIAFWEFLEWTLVVYICGFLGVGVLLYL